MAIKSNPITTLQPWTVHSEAAPFNTHRSHWDRMWRWGRKIPELICWLNSVSVVFCLHADSHPRRCGVFTGSHRLIINGGLQTHPFSDGLLLWFHNFCNALLFALSKRSLHRHWSGLWSRWVVQQCIWFMNDRPSWIATDFVQRLQKRPNSLRSLPNRLWTKFTHLTYCALENVCHLWLMYRIIMLDVLWNKPIVPVNEERHWVFEKDLLLLNTFHCKMHSNNSHSK